MADEDLRIQLEAFDKSFGPTLKKIATGLDQLAVKTDQSSKKQTASWDRVNKHMAMVGNKTVAVFRRMRSAMTSFTGLLVGGGMIMGLKKLGESAATFEKGLAEVSTLLDGPATASMERYKGALLEMALTSSRTITDLTRGLYQTISAGVTEEAKALKVLDLAQRASVAGLTTVETSVDALTTLVNAFGLSLEEADSAADLLFTTVRRGKLTFTPLANNIGKVATLAKQSGLSMEEMFAAISTMTKAGLDVELATTALRQVLANILKPAEEAKGVFDALGLTWGKDALAGGKFTETMHKLNQATGGNAQILTELIPNIRALTGAMVLAGDQVVTYDDDLRAMLDSHGALDEAFGKMANTMEEKVSIQWQRLAAQLMKIGEMLLPKTLSGLTSIADWVENNSQMLVDRVELIIDVFSSWLSLIGDIFRGLEDVFTLGAASSDAAARMANRAQQMREEREARGALEEFMTPKEAGLAIRKARGPGARAANIEAVRQQIQEMVQQADAAARGASEAVSLSMQRIFNRQAVLLRKAAVEMRQVMDKAISDVAENERRVQNEKEATLAARRKQALTAEEADRKDAVQKAMDWVDKATTKQLSAIDQVEEKYAQLGEMLRGHEESLVKLAKWRDNELAKIDEQAMARLEKAFQAAEKMEKDREKRVKEQFELIRSTYPVQVAPGTKPQREAPGAARAGLETAERALFGHPQETVTAGLRGILQPEEGGAAEKVIDIASALATVRPEEFGLMLDEKLDVLANLMVNLTENIGQILSKTLANLPRIIGGLFRIDLKAVIVDGILGGLKAFFEGFGSFFKDLFTGEGTAGRTLLGIATLGISELFMHEGGVVGQLRGNADRYAAALGDAAGRLQKAHSGKVIRLRPDEVPTVLQTGEGVLSRRGMAALERMNAGGSGGTVVNLNISPGAVVAARDAHRWVDEIAGGEINARRGSNSAWAVGRRADKVPGKTAHRRR
uniref:Putative tail protein n=1 Tax=viral metagenome TaxID=1070528 RepID=A0A6M3M1M3_9ZZZZ